jgi:hypothetical protein
VLLLSPLLLDYSSNVGRMLLLAPLAWRERHAVGVLWHTRRWSVVGMALINPLRA